MNEREERDRAAAATSFWLTAGQAGIRIGVHAATIRKLAKAGKLLGYGLGRLKRFKSTDCDSLLTPIQESPK